jgi:hypothetical protein
MALEPLVAHDRPTIMKTRTSILLIGVLLMTGACSAGAGASPSSSPVPSLSVSPVPSGSPDGSGSPAPSGGPITTPEQAAQRVAQVHPQLAGIGPKDPDLIGGCCWYEATPAADGYQVVFEVGWGDCQSGCIDRHQWTYRVTHAGEVTLVGETGPGVPKGILPE